MIEAKENLRQKLTGVIILETISNYWNEKILALLMFDCQVVCMARLP
jgi:hypothetical protein